MSSVSGLGPVTPPNEPRSDLTLGRALETYAKLFTHLDPSNPQNLEEIAKKTVELVKLASAVIHAASSTLRSTAGDLEHLLQSPLFVMNKEVSILTASTHYLENPSTAELKDLIQELCHNSLALKVMCDELALLIKYD